MIAWWGGCEATLVCGSPVLQRLTMQQAAMSNRRLMKISKSKLRVYNLVKA